jgi:MerR family mercuric resistance operon transcriptional regulator
MSKMENPMTIGQLARQAKTDTQTIRYYERIGLMEAPERTESNYRLYDLEAGRRLDFIRRAKEIGFSLSDIKVLLAMADGKVRECNEVRQFAEARLAKTRSRISRLKAMERILSQLVDQCAISENIAECPILETLTEEPG